MREDDEAERALSLGAPLERVWVTGNTKFDALAVPRARSRRTRRCATALGLAGGRAGADRRQHARGRGGGCSRCTSGCSRDASRAAAGDRAALHRARRRGCRRWRRPRGCSAGLRSADPAGATGGGARHHRRAGPRLPAGDAGLRRRQLHRPRRAEHPRARGAGAAGALRAAHGELPRQRAGAGRPRRHPGERRRAPVPGARRAAGPAGHARQPGRARRAAVRQVSGASQRNVDLVARLLLGAGARPAPRRAGSAG